MINIIAAMDKNGLIGRDGGLPWQPIKSDMQFFRTATLGRIVVMGSKTAASIGKPLPNRTSIILSRSSGISIQDIVDLSKKQDVFIIGGSQIYEQFLPYADRLIITHIDATFDGDTWFPEYDTESFVISDSRKGIDKESGLGFEICFYSRK